MGFSLTKYLFQNTIDSMVNQQVSQLTTNLFNKNVFQFLFNGDVIMQPENYAYVEKGFEQVGAVYECVDIIVKKMIACPRIVYKVKDQKEYKKYLNFSQSPETLPQALLTKSKALEEVNHPQIERLLNNPNPLQEGDSAYETLFAQYLLDGNAYLYGNAGNDADRAAKKWSEIWAVPGQMLIRSGGFMEPIKEYIMAFYIQNAPFPAAQIKHIKTLNPRYQATGQNLYGTSPLRPYLYSMDILKNADKQADKQVKNGGTMQMISPENKEDNWSQEQIDQVGQSLKDAYKSINQMDRTIPLSVAIKATKIGLTSAELELLKLSDAKADDIYRCYHIPLQFRSQDTATYNNLPVANRQLVYNAVAPHCRKFGIALTEFICKPYNTSHAQYIVELDYTGLPELMDDLKTMSAALKDIDFLTKNEKREILRYGRSAEKGADSIWVAITQTPMENIMDGTVEQGTAHVQAAITGQQTPAPVTPKSYLDYLKEQ